jgi:hypothetical protein
LREFEERDQHFGRFPACIAAVALAITPAAISAAHCRPTSLEFMRIIGAGQPRS